MKDKKIKTVKSWLDLKLAKDIQVFLGFANFYKKFIKNFSKIATLLILIFWTTGKPTNNNTRWCWW